jgi:hypothetical protein
VDPMGGTRGGVCHVVGLYPGEPGFMCTGAYHSTNRTHGGRPLYTHYTDANELMLMFYDPAGQSWIIGPSFSVISSTGRCMDVRDGYAKQPDEISAVWSGFDWDGNLEPNPYLCVWCSAARKMVCDGKAADKATAKPTPAPTTTPTAWAPWWPQGPGKHTPTLAPTKFKFPSWNQLLRPNPVTMAPGAFPTSAPSHVIAQPLSRAKTKKNSDLTKMLDVFEQWKQTHKDAHRHQLDTHVARTPFPTSKPTTYLQAPNRLTNVSWIRESLGKAPMQSARWESTPVTWRKPVSTSRRYSASSSVSTILDENKAGRHGRQSATPQITVPGATPAMSGFHFHVLEVSHGCYCCVYLATYIYIYLFVFSRRNLQR